MLGKHSDIQYDIDPSDFECVSNKKAEVDFFVRLGLSNGWNPLEMYIEQEEDREEADE